MDHLLYASADLERGMDEIEALLGVQRLVLGLEDQVPVSVFYNDVYRSSDGIRW